VCITHGKVDLYLSSIKKSQNQTEIVSSNALTKFLNCVFKIKTVFIPSLFRITQMIVIEKFLRTQSLTDCLE